MDASKEAMAAATEAVSSQEKRKELGTITLGNGIVLKLKRVPPFLIRQAVIRIPSPSPPKFRHEDKGGVEEDNPSDPVYQKELEEYEVKTAETALNAVLVAGTEVVSVPEGRFFPAASEWTELLDFLGIEIDSNIHGRYLAWLRYYAIEDVDDMGVLIASLGDTIGLREEEVARAVDSFRGGEVGGSDNSSPSEDSGHRDNVPADSPRNSTRSGGERGS